MLDHPTHRHWHFDATARYSLTSPRSGEVVASEDKVSFCLRDNRPVLDDAGRRHYGDCSRNRVQGLTPGWADVYRASLPGQALDLPAGLPDAVYCLRVEADPLKLLQETREDDNAAAVGVRIRGAGVSVVQQPGCTP
jgi:hypothetical protein